jgi:hypothetical protein
MRTREKTDREIRATLIADDRRGSGLGRRSGLQASGHGVRTLRTLSRTHIGQHGFMAVQIFRVRDLGVILMSWFSGLYRQTTWAHGS